MVCPHWMTKRVLEELLSNIYSRLIRLGVYIYGVTLHLRDTNLRVIERVMIALGTLVSLVGPLTFLISRY